MAERSASWGETLIGVSAPVLMLLFASCAFASLAGTAWLVHKFGLSWTAIGLTLGWLAAAVSAILCVQRRSWATLALLIVALRTGMYLVTQGVVTSTPDPHYYDLLAREMSRGRDFTDIVDGMQLKAHAPRLYSILLAGFYFASDGSRAAPFLLNGAIDALTGLVIFLTGRKLGAGLRASAAMGVLYLIWPHILVSSAFAQKEGLGSLLLLSCIWTLARSWSEGRIRGAFYGVLLGLLGLTQPAWFPLAAGLPLVLALRHRFGLVSKFLAVAAAASILVLSPWIVRNWIVTGGFIPLTSSFGWNLYANAARNMEIPQHLAHLPEAEWSREMAKAGVAIIAANPLAYAAHEVKMIATSLALEHGYLIGLTGLRPAPAIAPRDFLLAMQLPLVAMWAGAAWCMRERKTDALMIGVMAAIVISIAAIGIWFQFGQRHRAYLLPILLTWFSVVATQCRRDLAR